MREAMACIGEYVRDLESAAESMDEEASSLCQKAAKQQSSSARKIDPRGLRWMEHVRIHDVFVVALGSSAGISIKDAPSRTHFNQRVQSMFLIPDPLDFLLEEEKTSDRR